MFALFSSNCELNILRIIMKFIHTMWQWCHCINSQGVMCRGGDIADIISMIVCVTKLQIIHIHCVSKKVSPTFSTVTWKPISRFW